MVHGSFWCHCASQEASVVIDIRAVATFGSIWVLCAIMSGIIAGEKNRRFWVWFFIGLLTGPYGLYRSLKAEEIVPPELGQPCPNCKKFIRKTARPCPSCGYTLIREPDRVMAAGRQAAAAVFLLRRAAQKSTAAVKGPHAKRDARPPAT